MLRSATNPFREWIEKVETVSMAAGGDPAKRKTLVDRLVVPAENRLERAKGDLKKLEEFARSTEATWERISGIISETRNIASLWSRLTGDDGEEFQKERKTLLDYWILDTLIVVRPIPGMKRANEKSVIFRLATVPASPVHVTLDGRPARACVISSRTDGSDYD